VPAPAGGSTGRRAAPGVSERGREPRAAAPGVGPAANWGGGRPKGAEQDLGCGVLVWQERGSVGQGLWLQEPGCLSFPLPCEGGCRGLGQRVHPACMGHLRLLMEAEHGHAAPG